MDQNIIAFGTCAGTGAAIHVCIGFHPRYVKVWNVGAATDLPVAEWLGGLSAITALDEGILTKTLTDIDRSLLTTAGISAYSGGDEIVYDGASSNRWEDSAGNSVEEVYVDGHYERSAASDATYRCVGNALVGASTPRNGAKVKTPPGFTIGTNADLNVDGEQLMWMAIR